MSTTENLYTTDCIRTFTGKYIDVFAPNQADICIEDIAHALSHVPRFGGHLANFYSVAMHSISVYEYVRKQQPNDSKLLLQALMHDSTEAYLLDMPSPIKNRMPEYKAIEENLMKQIAWKFEFDYPFHPIIKEADRVILEREWNSLVVGSGAFVVVKGGIVAMDAKEMFLGTFNELTK